MCRKDGGWKKPGPGWPDVLGHEWSAAKSATDLRRHTERRAGQLLVPQATKSPRTRAAPAIRILVVASTYASRADDVQQLLACFGIGNCQRHGHAESRTAPLLPTVVIVA